MPTPTSLTLDAHLTQAGPAARSFAQLWAKLWRQQTVPPEVLELCRITFARLHADAAEIEARNPYIPQAQITAGRRQALLAGKAHRDPAFSPAERAVLQFAEVYWMDAQSLTDELADEVKAHYGEPGLVLLIEALGCIDGRIRASRCLRDLAAHAPVPAETSHAC